MDSGVGPGPTRGVGDAAETALQRRGTCLLQPWLIQPDGHIFFEVETLLPAQRLIDFVYVCEADWLEVLPALLAAAGRLLLAVAALREWS